MLGKVKCAICGNEISPSNGYYCSNCEIWICQRCSGVGIFSNAKCPRCHRSLKEK